LKPETPKLETDSLNAARNVAATFPIDFPVVGIGASAGGLDAFKKLLPAIPSNSRMAWILVQHLDPTHESMLAELLRKVTELPVTEVTDHIKILPDHIYIIPSNKILQVKEDRLKLSARPLGSAGRGIMPVDIFFASLAQVYEAHAIGVILSGTASDGTKGLKFIKDHGGITIAQKVETAAYAGMPQNAIESGLVDFILEPEKIPGKLAEIIKALAGPGDPPANEEEDIFQKILSILRARKEMDFSYYKQTTIRRRILRRMVLNKFPNIRVYLKFLEENTSEQDFLYQDMLIPVTSFFRDKKIFDNLCKSVFPSIIKNKSAEGNIRIWVAGCSTGQEAYSIAICFMEYLGHKKEKIQIFATDLSEPAILKARSGMYTKTEAEAVSHSRLKEYFTYRNGQYRVNKELRDICVFAVHNFLKDPPFGKIDFITCRNVLIYMDSYLQKKALSTFHYALNPNGLLLLGKSENTIGVTELFNAKGKNDKIFSKKAVPSRLTPTGNRRAVAGLHLKVDNKSDEFIPADFQKTADDLILNQFAPAGVVINEAMDIVHFRGNTSAFLGQAPGKPTHNLLKMARPGLAFELRNVVHKVKIESTLIKRENIVFPVNGHDQLITVTALPLPNTIETLYLLLFQQQTAIPKKFSRKGHKTKQDEKLLRIEQLETEIALLREDMRVITDEQEASNEELQSGNEELMSSNEELQSLNEELETSKEELQSTIEELTVVNQEMVNLNDQLILEKEYAEAIIATVPQPMLVLDQHFKVLLANESFYIKFNLNQSEIEGRLVYEMANRDWNIEALRVLLETILPHQQSFLGYEIEHHFESLGTRTMVVNAREIVKNKEEKLILLAIEDRTDIRQSTKQIEEREEQLRSVIAAAPIAIAIFKGRNLIIENPNQTFRDLLGKGDDIEGKPLSEVMPELQTENQPFLKILDDVFTSGKMFQTFATPVKVSFHGRMTNNFYDFTYTPLFDKNGKVYAILEICKEVTEQVAFTKKLEQSEKYFRQLTDTVPAIIWITQRDGFCSYLNQPWCDYTGQTRQEGEGFGWLNATHPDDKEAAADAFIKANNAQQLFAQSYRIKNKSGEYRWVLNSGSPKYSEEGEYEGMIGTVMDIHEEKLSALALRQSEEKFQGAVAAVQGIVWTNNAAGEMEGEQKAWADLTGQTFEEYQGYGWAKAVHPDDAQPTIDAWNKAVATRTTFVFEHRVKVKDDSWRQFSIRAIPLINLDGTIREWVGVHTDVTKKRKAENALIESEKRFRLLADQSPMHIYILEADENASVIYWNKSWLEYTGQTFEEALGTAWDGIVHPADVPAVMSIYQPAFEARQAYNIPAIRLKRHDGEYRWHAFKANPRFLANGDFNGFVGVGFDIQDQKLIEYALKESEHRFSNMIYSSPSLITILKGDDLVIEIANDAIIEIWGKGPDVVGKPYFTLLPELIDQGLGELIRGVYHTGEPVYANEMPLFLIRYGKKEMKYYDFLLQAHRNVKGEIEGVAIIATNVTPQAEFNKKIKQSEENFRQLSDLMPTMVSNSDQGGNVFYYNQTWMDYTGFTHEELQNWGWAKAMHPDELEKITRRWQHSLSTGENFEMELRLLNHQGQYNWHLSRAVAVRDEEGHIVKWVCTTTDIQKIKEEEQRKEDFLKMVSHELKTPVTSIKGYVQLLLTMLEEKDKVPAIPLKTSLGRIDSQVLRLTRLITEMLDLSRIEAGKLELQQTTFSLNALVEETVQDVLHTSPTHTINIQHDLGCSIEGDEDRIGQVLINFLNNAIKYSPAQSQVDVHVHKAGENLVAVSVKDTGIGIEKKDQQKIFERFYRVGGESELSYSGFGIGLFIANEIIQRHDGYIIVNSEKGQGSTFTFFLPVKSINTNSWNSKFKETKI
jgi:two-component system CheB/CheR fusion protein